MRAPDDKAERRAADRERQREYRMRAKNGKAIYPAEIDGEVLNMLVRLGWLKDSDTTKKKCVGKAISELLADAARR